MILRIGHVAVTRRSEAASDLFFVGLLGLEKSRARELSADLANRIFGRPVECRMIDYERDGIRFEVFVPAEGEPGRRAFGHVCLEIGDRERLVERCRDAGVRVVRVARDSSDILFLEDADGNLYEIQEARQRPGDSRI